MTMFQGGPNEAAVFALSVPLLPLPDLVLFPGILLPLHLQEPQAIALARDAVAADGMLAVGTIQSASQYIGQSPATLIHPTVCLSQIVIDQELDSDRVRVLIRGMERARVFGDEATERPYRTVQLMPCPDIYPESATIDRDRRRRELLLTLLQPQTLVHLGPLFHHVVDLDTPLSQICDTVAHALHLPIDHALELLDEANVDLRSDLLLIRLRELARQHSASRPRPEYAPPFSSN